MNPDAGSSAAAVMQPYFLPYIGYWQLIYSVDCFVIHDDIKYTKRGWINRNRYLLNGQPQLFSIPLRKDSDYSLVRDRYLSEGASAELFKIKRKLESAYRGAPAFEQGCALLEQVLTCNEKNLFDFLMHSIQSVSDFLGLQTRVVVSSSLGVSRELEGQNRVIAICKAVGCSEYLNPIGGLELYEPDAFRSSGIQLFFQRVQPIEYRQFDNLFVPNLSILDAIMFLGVEGVRKLLPQMIKLAG